MKSFVAFLAILGSGCLCAPQPATVIRDECYVNNKNPYVFFATRTSYSEVDNEDKAPKTYPSCEAKSIWWLARHGTRNADSDEIKTIQGRAPELAKQILANHVAGKGSLCDKDIALLKEWTFNQTGKEPEVLLPAGIKEHNALGQRFAARFPGLVAQGKAQNEKVKVLHTGRQRTEASSKSFIQGAFDVPTITGEKNTDLLRFFEHCPKWVADVEKNPATKKEQDLFTAADDVKTTVDTVSKKLGFDTPLNFTDINMMYDLCAYEKAWNSDKVSIWCSAFEQSDLEALEYREDLDCYYKHGYSNPLNGQSSCPLVKDLVDTFNAPAATRRVGSFYFAHSESILPFLTLLGLYEDATPLTHANYAEHKDRKFRSSRIASFAANVEVAYYECTEAPLKRVVVFDAETPVKLPKCDKEDCDWAQFQELFKDGINCKFDELCKV